MRVSEHNEHPLQQRTTDANLVARPLAKTGQSHGIAAIDLLNPTDVAGILSSLGVARAGATESLGPRPPLLSALRTPQPSAPRAPRASVRGQKPHLHIDVAGIGETQRVAIAARGDNPLLDKAIVGAMKTIDELQVRDRPGQQSCDYDSSGGDGCASKMKLGKRFIASPTDVVNEVGGWSSYVHIGKEWLGQPGLLPMSVPDYNMFVTAFTSYPLFLIDDSSLPHDQQMVGNTLELATDHIQAFKRGKSYAFWTSRPDQEGNPVVGMMNMSPNTLGTMAKTLNSRVGRRILDMLGDRVGPMKDPLLAFTTGVMDPEKNPLGPAAFMNIANDADDTAVAAAHLLLNQHHAARTSKAGARGAPPPDPAALRELSHYRDVHPETMSWLQDRSGAFAVWLRDPDKPAFSDPSDGDLSGGLQVLDEVVNANAVFALALHGMRDVPGYREAVALIEKSAREKHWQKESIYYPNLMVFPYTVSRAYRDGGARDPGMKNALKLMLVDVLDLFDEQAKDRSLAGSFPSGADNATDLSTAYGAIFLLNVGEDLAKEAGVADRYNKALESSITRLTARGAVLKKKTDSGRQHKGLGAPLVWEESVFFSSGPRNAGMWVSRAQTTATVLEAFTKYRMGYDKGSSTILDAPVLKVQ